VYLIKTDSRTADVEVTAAAAGGFDADHNVSRVDVAIVHKAAPNRKQVKKLAWFYAKMSQQTRQI